MLDDVGFFTLSSMVKVRGQNSNRNTVKQTAENDQKISGDDGGQYCIMVPGVKNPRLRNCLEIDRA